MIDQEMLRTAFASLVERIVVFLPSVLAAILVMGAGWIVARLVSSMGRRILGRLGVDEMVASSDLAARLEVARIDSVSGLVGKLLYWIVLLFFAAVAVQRLGVDLSVVPLSRLLVYLPHVVGAVLLLVFGSLLAQLAGRATDASARGLGVSFHRSLGRGVRALLFVVVGVLTLEQLGFDVELVASTLVNLVTITVAGIVLMFALGGQGVARSVLSGLYVRQSLKTGEHVEIDGEVGTIEAIGPVSSEIRRSDATTVLIPNSVLVESRLVVRRSD